MLDVWQDLMALDNRLLDLGGNLERCLYSQPLTEQ